MTTAYFREETHKRLYSFSIRQKYIEDALRVAIYEVDSTALIGADGGRSTVRSLSGIEFSGTISDYHWVRMDAVVSTDMPHSRRGGVAIESLEHGNVLWTPTDNGRTRIGFVCPPHLYGPDGKTPTAKQVMAEEKKAVRPFSRSSWS